jgi:hypothetical protein
MMEAIHHSYINEQSPNKIRTMDHVPSVAMEVTFPILLQVAMNVSNTVQTSAPFSHYHLPAPFLQIQCIHYIIHLQ